MEKRFLILEGATGKVKKDYALPDPEAHDCIIIANLSGGPWAREILLKDRYRRIWAMSNSFELLWLHEGNMGHFPWAQDINGDGFDEVMAGYDLLDHNGRKLWSCHDLEDHADCLWVGDVNGDGKDGMFLLSCEGKELWKEDRKTKGWLTIVDMLSNWNGSGRDYILAYRRGGGVNMAINCRLFPSAIHRRYWLWGRRSRLFQKMGRLYWTAETFTEDYMEEGRGEQPLQEREAAG